MKISKKAMFFIGLLVFLVASGCWRNVRTGIYVGDQFFVEKGDGYYKSGEDELWMTRGDGFTNFKLIQDGGMRSAALVWSRSDRLFDVEHDYATITFADGTVVRGTWFANDMLVDDSGTPLIFLDYPLMTVTVGGEPVPLSNTDLSHVFCRLDLGMTTKNGSIGFVIIGALIYGFGVLTFLYPEKVYFFGNRWRYRNPELSDDGIMMQQFGGIVCMIVGFVIALNLPRLVS